MAIRTLKETSTFLGLSTDTKPTNALDGTQFKETDTGAIYFYDAVTQNWVLEFSSISVVPIENVFVSGKKLTTTASTGGFQLWNPSGSGVKLRVEALDLSMSENMDIFVYNTTVAFTTLLSNDMGNTNFGGSAPDGETYTQASGTVTGSRFSTFALLATEPETIWELIGTTITEGTGLALVTSGAATIRTRISWTESAV